MGVINLLSKEISNKIAAGEVVERPASVVKELVENSIDAGADTIVVEIRHGGNTYIRVADNGCGMSEEDAKIAFLRHATSKIKTDEDLNAIYTLGFRGEALSSIGAVAKVDLYTRTGENDTGIHVICCGGEINDSIEEGMAQGTTFIVRDLFYNTPARMKFLKKDSTETGHITDIISKFILAHPEISFKLISDNKERLFSAGDNRLINAVYTVYGRDYAKAAIDVEYENESIRVTGIVGKGNVCRPNRNYENFFVNRRYIKSPLMMKAAEEAYKNQIMIGKFPMVILNLEINPEMIDINVHPTKLEVKFSNEKLIYETVYHGVKNALYAMPNIPEFSVNKEQDDKEEFPRVKNPFSPATKEKYDRKISRQSFELKDFSSTKDSGFKQENITSEEYNNKQTHDLSEYKIPVDESKFDTINRLPFEEYVESIPRHDSSDYTKHDARNKSMIEQLVSDPVISDDENNDAQFTKEELNKVPVVENIPLKDNRKLDKIDKLISEPIISTEHGNFNPEDFKDMKYMKNFQVPKGMKVTDGDLSMHSTEPELPEIKGDFISDDEKSDFEIIGQIFGTYIIVEKDKEMLIFDQHAAHERLNYEALKREIENGAVNSQMLLEPVVTRLSSVEMCIYGDNIEFFQKLGFDISEFGENTLLINAIPMDINDADTESLIVELITQLGESKNEIITEKFQRALYTTSCKKAIKANHYLDEKEMRWLVKSVLELENINTCPHGRPIMIKMTQKDMEKEFKRIV